MRYVQTLNLHLTPFAPIAVFAYKRPEKFEALINSLKNCREAQHSSLYIFLDVPNSKSISDENNRIEWMISQITGFKQVNLIKRAQHFGLSKNITEGINEIFKAHDQIIVLEEDLVVSSQFLTYMNCALQKYKNFLQIFHIAAHCDSLHRRVSEPFFFTRKMDCWGWATWKNRWTNFNKDPQKLLKAASPEFIYEFDFHDSYQLWNQVVQNVKGDLDTWAVFWQAAISAKSGLSLTPNSPFVVNSGQDGSGQHGVWSRETKKLNFSFKPSDLPNQIVDSTFRVISISKGTSNLEILRDKIIRFNSRVVIGIKRKLKGLKT